MSGFQTACPHVKNSSWCNKRCINMLLCLRFIWSKPPHPADWHQWLASARTHWSPPSLIECFVLPTVARDCSLTHSPWCLASGWVTLITASTSKQCATISSFACGNGRRTCSQPATAGTSRDPRSPASPASLHILASPTRSYKSTQTQHAACLNAGMNQYPILYRISRFDVRINVKIRY